MTPIYYSSTDADAPVLSGTVGALNSLLRAVLVNGYGIKPGAGWTEPFMPAGNIAVFRAHTTRAEGQYVRVDNSGSGTGGAREALLRVYAEMTDLSTGTEPMPTVAQSAHGIVWPVSATSDSTPRAWQAWATDRWVHIAIEVTSHSGVPSRFFASTGRLLSRAPGDLAAWYITGGLVMNTASSTACGYWYLLPISSAAPTESTTVGTANPAGQIGWIMREVGAAAGPVPITGDAAAGAITVPGNATSYGAYPDPVSGGVVVRPWTVHTSAWALRGRMPNLYWPAHDNIPLTHDAIYTVGGASMRAVTMQAWRLWQAGDDYKGQLLVDESSDA